ncbi:heptaprenyl diphosphate synthase [Paenibacillus yonginensis]|uniref:Heptaprenyl diphosphate synthase n=1 Tax=Paenibacillus yonginensis TaxID=1462996 RepID=A0A1B1N5X7_9BACL|nr:polyprenyl synthetase family protein [Paenibacillus yonginensis]ANS76826.1 heptaprenyl diphosphate synthase [Paenibacillus yonginensis]
MKLNEALQIHLPSVDREIVNIVKHDPDVSRSSVVAEAITSLIASGGKRLRPLMVIVGSRFGPSSDKKKIWRLAAAAEFIHAASLIHDDMLDNSPLRRGRPATHTQTGIYPAVHIGSYMSARVVELIAEYSADRKRYVFDLSSVATSKLCLGEYQQLKHAYDYDLTLDQYLEKSRNKTSLLMAACLRIGAQAAGADEAAAGKLYEFGDKLGLSFQIRDDLLDFTGTEEQLGKPAGSDLRSGQVTLPVLFALEDAELAPRIRRIGPETPQSEVEGVVAAIKSSGSLERAEAYSVRLLEEARQIAAGLESFEAQRDLFTLLDYFGCRSH